MRALSRIFSACIVFVLALFSCQSSVTSKETPDVPVLPEGNWYRRNQDSYYSSQADEATKLKIAKVMSGINIFPPVSILSFSGNEFNLYSFTDDQMLGTGSCSFSGGRIVLNFKSGDLNKKQLEGDYVMSDNQLTIRLERETLANSLKYNAEGTELLLFHTDSVSCTYTFDKTAFTQANIYEGIYTGQALFQTLDPIRDFKVNVTCPAENLLSLSFDALPYGSTTVDLKNIPTQSKLQSDNKTLLIQAIDKNVTANGMNLVVNYEGTIKDQRLDISLMTIKGGLPGVTQQLMVECKK